MMLKWSAEQPTEISTRAIDLEFLPTESNEDRGVRQLAEESVSGMAKTAETS